MPGWKGRVTSRQAPWKLWAAEASLPPSPWQPRQMKERERERARVHPTVHPYEAANADTLQSFVSLESAEKKNCFPTDQLGFDSLHYLQFTSDWLNNSILPIRLWTHSVSETWPFSHICTRHVSPTPSRHAHTACLHNNHVLAQTQGRFHQTLDVKQ